VTRWIVLGLTIGAMGGPAAVEPPRLNVLWIISDDLNNALGCYGNAIVRTPNIDRLAARGVRFDRAYCNYPLCNPSRTSFLSGRYPDTTGILSNTVDPRTNLGRDFQFAPEYFRARGYFTAGVGKIAHGRFSDAVAWDLYEEPARGGKKDPQKKKNKQAKKEPQQDLSMLPWKATDGSDEDEPDGRVARRIVKLLEERPGDRPFFIAAGFHKPHLAHVAPRKYFDLYPPEKIATAPEPAADAQGIPPLARPGHYYPDLTEAQRREAIAHYYACVSFMDAQVGLLLDALDRLKLWENTVVVFIGDHGWHLGEHGGFWAKTSLMEESARTPLIVAAPGRKAGVGCARLVEFVDIYPTLTELCGLPPAEGVEGLSVVPLLDDPARPWKKGAFTVVHRRNDLGRAVRTETHTYIRWPDGGEQLYERAKDPRETANLARDPAQAATLAELRKLLKDGWRAARPTSLRSP
jgi:uncharacterized sulfatase